jgi:hypothetical protein
MTEAQWLASTDPRPMLEFLRDKASDRQLRLFACAYTRVLRGYWHLGPGAAVAVAERYADGLASARDLASERRGVPFPDMYSEWVLAPSAYDGVCQAVDGLTSARDLMTIDPDALRHFPFPLDDAVQRAVLLLRDIFGSRPFRPVNIAPDLLAWNDGTVGRIAEGIYDERTFDRLPILADALLDAGCNAAELLAHCRNAGPHVRGCWVVDTILGKN